MYPQSSFRAIKKRIIIFHLKINIFTAVKYCCILHGRVCVMFPYLVGTSYPERMYKRHQNKDCHQVSQEKPEITHKPLQAVHIDLKTNGNQNQYIL